MVSGKGCLDCEARSLHLEIGGKSNMELEEKIENYEELEENLEIGLEREYDLGEYKTEAQQVIANYYDN